jgi:hypothetical protein
MNSFANDYVDVAERINQFYKLHPNGRIITDDPIIVKDLDGKAFIQVTAWVYRDLNDEQPAGKDTAWEPWPGKTNFTRDSEMMNASTSATGRALVYAGIASKKVASRDDVVKRRAEQAAETNAAIQPPAPRPESMGSNGKWINEPTSGVTDAQVRKIQAQLATLNVAKGERSRTYVSDILKRDVGSISQLTKLEGSKLIEQLTETIAKTQAVATIVYDETKLDAALGDAV